MSVNFGEGGKSIIGSDTLFWACTELGDFSRRAENFFYTIFAQASKKTGSLDIFKNRLATAFEMCY